MIYLNYFIILKASDLTPQVVTAARIVMMNPNNQASVEHYDLLKKQWVDNMEKMRGLVDEAVDTAAFIRACGEILTLTMLDVKSSY